MLSEINVANTLEIQSNQHNCLEKENQIRSFFAKQRINLDHFTQLENQIRSFYTTQRKGQTFFDHIM